MTTRHFSVTPSWNEARSEMPSTQNGFHRGEYLDSERTRFWGSWWTLEISAATRWNWTCPQTFSQKEIRYSGQSLASMDFPSTTPKKQSIWSGLCLRHFQGRHQIALSSAGQPKDAFARSMFAQQLSEVLQVLPVMLQHPANSAVEPRKEIPWANAGEIRWKPQKQSDSYNPNFKTFFLLYLPLFNANFYEKMRWETHGRHGPAVSPFHHPAREPGFAAAIFDAKVMVAACGGFNTPAVSCPKRGSKSWGLVTLNHKWIQQFGGSRNSLAFHSLDV